MVNNFTYIRDIPDGPNNPSNDQPNMKTNNNSIESTIKMDHVGFNKDNSGYHTIIHQVRQTVDPALIPMINQLFCKNYTPDTTGGVADVQLFSANGAGGVVQMTGSAQQQEGFVWCAGLLLQWGSVTFGGVGSSQVTGTRNFKDRAAGAIEFPTDCFIVIPTLKILNALTTTASNTIAIRTIDNEKFTWTYNSSSSSGSADFPGFYWFAIGN
jgi:hypothetical protein